jgi:hypothetical protein
MMYAIEMASIEWYCQVYEWLDGFQIGNRFIEHLQMITANNYSTIANSHTLQFTIACTKSSQCAISSLVITC